MPLSRHSRLLACALLSVLDEEIVKDAAHG